MFAKVNITYKHKYTNTYISQIKAPLVPLNTFDFSSSLVEHKK